MTDLLRISDAAADAFQAIQLPENGPDKVRIYIQGVG